MTGAELKVFPDKEALASAAADWFVERLRENPGRIAICITGGSTPEGMYRQLAARPLPWERIHVFWSDERFVPEGDPLSNARMARRAMLDHVPIPSAQVHPIPTATAGPEESAATLRGGAETLLRRGHARSGPAAVRSRPERNGR